MHLLLLSDIHGNFPALEAVWNHFRQTPFTAILNCGDSLVYAPFPNETINWLRRHKVYTILGNTDRKVVRLLEGKTFRKPSRQEKRIMYSHTARVLSKQNCRYLCELKKKCFPDIPQLSLHIGMFHGSPEDPEECLSDTTPTCHFAQLAQKIKERGIDIVVTGHSHSPYHKYIDGVHFINPGSVGRMFDGNPQASCAVLDVEEKRVTVRHYRLNYPVERVIRRLQEENFPEIYRNMYTVGRKLN